MSGSQTKMRSRGGNVALYIPVAVLLVLFACILGVSVFLRVSAVEVRGAGGKYQPEDIMQTAGIRKGENLLFVHEGSIEEKLRAELPYIEYVDVRRKLPDTIVIELTESVPVAFVYSGSQGWIIDSKCRVLDVTAEDTGALIRVDGITPVEPELGEYLSLGDMSTSRLEHLVITLAAMEAAGITNDVESVDISSIANISFRYLDRFAVVIGNTDQIDYKLERLALFVSSRDEDAAGKINLSTPGSERLEPV